MLYAHYELFLGCSRHEEEGRFIGKIRYQVVLIYRKVDPFSSRVHETVRKKVIAKAHEQKVDMVKHFELSCADKELIARRENAFFCNLVRMGGEEASYICRAESVNCNFYAR